ncbi:MAG: pyrroline-5-carboxylate reductase [Crocinitomicaceae bacterium]|nr:pyrroline-5-carboxylate reductase [Crocinitomicaceae bacterium]
MDTKIAMIGTGNLGQSIVNGLIQEDAASNIIATRRNVNKLSTLKEQGVDVTDNNAHAVNNAEIILLGLKPYTILETIEGLKDQLVPGKHVLVSLATGISIEEISNVVGEGFEIYRAMPNTGASVNESLTCICGPEDGPNLEKVKQIFDTIGESIIINENLMEAATVLGACGIAYVLRFIRAMVQGGIEIGFDANTASKIVNQTVLGASQMLIQNGNHPEDEIDKVTTPKGCTISGLNQMEHNGFSSSLIKGILTSFEKIEK